MSTPLPPNPASQSADASVGRSDLPERGFTLIEVTVTIIIISLLSAIVLVAVAHARRGAQREAEHQLLVALKQGIVQFESEFKFLPPLVTPARLGNNPRYGNSRQPAVMGENSNATVRETEVAYMQGFTGSTASGVIPDDQRYSVHSLSFYLMGMCDDTDPTTGKAVDGVTGPGFTAPRIDGSFTQKGKSHEAIYDVSSDLRRLTAPGGQVDRTGPIYDRWHNAVRYYRWTTRLPDPGADPASPNAKARTLLPRAIGGGLDPRLSAQARGARYALVILGPDGATDSGPPLEVGVPGEPVPPIDAAAKDDIVEVE